MLTLPLLGDQEVVLEVSSAEIEQEEGTGYAFGPKRVVACTRTQTQEPNKEKANTNQHRTKREDGERHE